jgi:hypothetical protein
MVNRVPRRKMLGIKLTAEEYAGLVSRAGGQPVSEWARGVLLGQAGVAREAREARADHGSISSAAHVPLLAELLALRAIVLNLQYALAGGERITAERMRELITRADADKHSQARKRLEELREH